MNTNIKTKTGEISAYGFACGYVETLQENGNMKELFKEHNTYHLRMFRGSQRVIWLSYTSLKIARKDYNNTSLA